MSDPKLSRPGKDYAAGIRQEVKAIRDRNIVECGIKNEKRKLGLSLIMLKLQITAGDMIGREIFILDMEN